MNDKKGKRIQLVTLLIRKSAKQNEVGLSRDEANWLIDECQSFTDEELGSMIGMQAVSVFRQMVEMIK